MAGIPIPVTRSVAVRCWFQFTVEVGGSTHAPLYRRIAVRSLAVGKQLFLFFFSRMATEDNAPSQAGSSAPSAGDLKALVKDSIRELLRPCSPQPPEIPVKATVLVVSQLLVLYYYSLPTDRDAMVVEYRWCEAWMPARRVVCLGATWRGRDRRGVLLPRRSGATGTSSGVGDTPLSGGRVPVRTSAGGAYSVVQTIDGGVVPNRRCIGCNARRLCVSAVGFACGR